MLCLLNRPLNAQPLIAISLFSIALSGCTTPSINSPPALGAELSAATLAGKNSAVLGQSAASSAIRYGRYTFASTSPRSDQVDLLSQVVDIRIPDSLSPSVNEALNYVLRHSGYHLCPGNEVVQQLYAHPLPASHYRLGPMTVRDALITLAGTAWGLELDEKSRSVCFSESHRAAAAVTTYVTPLISTKWAGGHQ